MKASINQQLQQTQQELLDWANNAVVQGWLDADYRDQINALEIHTPADLFAQTQNQTDRPLVVALFGGTGVGKSTLLNRLADQDIAAASVVRPTSREVTVYLHKSIETRDLQTLLPLQNVGVARHEQRQWEHVVWIDTPDIDSLETENHQRILQWLPYVDLLLYVVNSERYRDDRGWKLLQESAAEHAWMFIFNHWDRAHPEQKKDFAQLLSKAGFTEPNIYCTDCRSQQSEDDYAQLLNDLSILANERAANVLELRTQSNRWQALTDLRAHLEHSVGNEPNDSLLSQWQSDWKQSLPGIIEGNTVKWRQFAAQFETQRTGIKALLFGPGESEPKISDVIRQQQIPVDDTCIARFKAEAENLIKIADELHLPISPLKRHLEQCDESLEIRFIEKQTIRLLELEASLYSGLKYHLRKCMHTLAIILPLIVVAWAGYRLLSIYLDPTSAGYLGLDFALHSLMLTGLAWILPQVMGNLLIPNWPRKIQDALKQGVQDAGFEFDLRVQKSIQAYKKEQAEFVNQLPIINQHVQSQADNTQSTLAPQTLNLKSMTVSR